MGRGWVFFPVFPIPLVAMATWIPSAFFCKFRLQDTDWLAETSCRAESLEQPAAPEWQAARDTPDHKFLSRKKRALN